MIPAAVASQRFRLGTNQFNTLRPRQDGWHFADDIFKCIFLNENIWIKSSLKFVPRGPINNIPALVQIMAWRQPGDKPLSDDSLLTHINQIMFGRELPYPRASVPKIVCVVRRSTSIQLIFSCDQAALQMAFSVCPSVCHTFLTMFPSSYHHEMIITNDQSKVHAKGQGQRSKVKVTEVTTQLNRFRTVTPVWIHIWWWNDAYSLMLLRRGALLFFKVIRQISRSHGSKNRRIWPKLVVSGL